MLNHGGIVNGILGGWQTNGILTIQTGQPFSPVLQTSTTNGTGSRPDIIGTGDLSEDPAALVRSERLRHTGSVHLRQRGRNSLFGPGRTNWDMSLFKNFVIREEMRFEIRAEAFNSAEPSAVRLAEPEHRQCAGGFDHEHRRKPAPVADGRCASSSSSENSRRSEVTRREH